MPCCGRVWSRRQKGMPRKQIGFSRNLVQSYMMVRHNTCRWPPLDWRRRFPKGPKSLKRQRKFSNLCKNLWRKFVLYHEGLSAPDIDSLSLGDVVKRAVEDHAEHSPLRPDVSFRGSQVPELSLSDKLCVFRFLQETLSNAARYAPAANCTVISEAQNDRIVVKVKDDGPGFDRSEETALRDDGGQGLMGLRDRVESIGGRFEVASRPGEGTTIAMTLFPRKLGAS